MGSVYNMLAAVEGELRSSELWTEGSNMHASDEELFGVYECD